MKKLFFFLVASLLTVISLSGCKSDKDDSGQLPVIESAIPNGLIPGSALTLKGRNFATVKYVQFANGAVQANQFLRTASNELTLRVPPGTQAGAVQIANETGLGAAKTMNLLSTNSNLTYDNVATNVGTITVGTFSNQCSPDYIFYCVRNTCIYIERQPRREKLGEPGQFCQPNFTEEQIGNSTFEVLQHSEGTFKYQKAGSSGYTGLVMIDFKNGGLHIGNIRKDSKLVVYSVSTGAELVLCVPDARKFRETSFNDPPAFCREGICQNCR